MHTGNKVEFNTVDFVEPATNQQQSWTFLNVQQSWTSNFVAGLFGNNLNIYESLNDPVTSLFLLVCVSLTITGQPRISH